MSAKCLTYATHTADCSSGDMAVGKGQAQQRSDRVSVLGLVLHGSEPSGLHSRLVAVFLQQLLVLGLHIHLVTDQLAR